LRYRSRFSGQVGWRVAVPHGARLRRLLFVRPGVAGTVVNIIVENAAMVEHEQPLILINPD